MTFNLEKIEVRNYASFIFVKALAFIDRNELKSVQMPTVLIVGPVRYIAKISPSSYSSVHYQVETVSEMFVSA